MGDGFVLSCLLLVFSTLAVGETGESATKSRCSHRPLGRTTVFNECKTASLGDQPSCHGDSSSCFKQRAGGHQETTYSFNCETAGYPVYYGYRFQFRSLGKKELPWEHYSRLCRFEIAKRATEFGLGAEEMTPHTGVAGGKWYGDKGSGSNPLCLTRTPQFDNTVKPTRYYGTLYGAEYEFIHGHHNHDVPCSVCLAPQSTTIMVPATLTCPPEWTPHYTGHLVSQYKDNYATKYVCLDGSPEDDSSGVRNDDGLVFYYVVTVCGSLPCPPYINDKVVTCVVCSK